MIVYPHSIQLMTKPGFIKNLSPRTHHYTSTSCRLSTTAASFFAVSSSSAASNVLARQPAWMKHNILFTPNLSLNRLFKYTSSTTGNSFHKNVVFSILCFSFTAATSTEQNPKDLLSTDSNHTMRGWFQTCHCESKDRDLSSSTKKESDSQSIFSFPNKNKKDGENNPLDSWNLQLDDIAQRVGSQVQGIINTGIPTEISYGFVCGYSSGYALKKVGKIVSIVFGLGFVTLQGLAYGGYIQFNPDAIKRNIYDKYLDLNQDGKVDEQDLRLLYQKAMEILTFSMASGAGFSTGFLAGLRSG